MSPRFRQLIPLAAPILIGLALAGCTDRTMRSDASPAALAACRARADAVYNTQNRDDIFRQDAYATGQKDSPFHGATVLGGDSIGLSNRYAREKFIDTCLAGVRDRTTTPDPLDKNPTAATIKPPAP